MPGGPTIDAEREKTINCLPSKVIVINRNRFRMLEWGWNVYAETYYAGAKIGRERDPFFPNDGGRGREGYGREEWCDGQT